MHFEKKKIGMVADISSTTIEKEKRWLSDYEYDNIPLHTNQEYANHTEQILSESAPCDLLVGYFLFAL